MPEEHLRLLSGLYMQRSREKRRWEKRGRGKREEEEKGERGERKGCVCVGGCKLLSSKADRQAEKGPLGGCQKVT